MSTLTLTKTDKRLRPSPWDALVVAAVLALAAVLFFGVVRRGGSVDTLLCTVSQNGQVLDEIRLTAGSPDQTLEYGDYTLEINHGHVCIQRAPCANQDCVHTGWISRPGQSIVCLPGRFIVELGGEDEHPDYDIVVK